MSVNEALLALARGDRAEALESCDRASTDLSRHLADHLRSHPGTGVYVDPAAFESFISGGSNVALYASTIEILAASNDRRALRSLLDIGCGDGRMTAATVPRSCESVHLLEPSHSMLESAIARFADTEIEIESSSTTVQQLLTDRPDTSWDGVQATFALHNVAAPERHDVFRTLASRTGALAIVEFDVPAFEDHSVAHAEYATATYEAGIAEYRDDPSVIEGFLMPVLVGQFDPERPRHTYEQPAESWAGELVDAGFTDVTTTAVAPFWWADAVLVEAAGHRPDRT
ncbi:MAG: class I SAM-dependent methyltransferase [Ilumatobacter sp.]|uniref:class I SAM-dependent methyltransferase n=1 Tax=Ilumatobacter sp. TaxID=1967498 RepID=UPI0032968F73